MQTEIIAFPHQKQSESRPEFRERIRAWDRKRIEKAHDSGAYRLLPYEKGLTARQRGLLLTLAWHSWSVGGKTYEPVQMSAGTVAAILGAGRKTAGRDLRRLVEVSAVEIVRPGAGNRPTVYRVRGLLCQPAQQTASPSTTSNPEDPSRDPEPPDEPPDAPPDPSPDPKLTARIDARRSKLVAAVVEKLSGLVSPRMALKLCDEVGVEEVEQQLQWFPHRDHGWAKNGLGAAFVTYCRDKRGEPKAVVVAHHHQRERKQDHMRRKKENAEKKLELQTVERAYKALSEEQIEQARRTVRRQLRLLRVSEKGAVFRGALDSEVIKLARKVWKAQAS